MNIDRRITLQMRALKKENTALAAQLKDAQEKYLALLSKVNTVEAKMAAIEKPVSK